MVAGLNLQTGTLFNSKGDEGNSRQAPDFGRGTFHNNLTMDQHHKNKDTGNVC
jgi:hypothetical protein